MEFLMNLITISLGVLFATVSSAMIAYISMATMIGPWIAPVIVLLSAMALQLSSMDKKARNAAVVGIQTIGSVGGIVGMAVGFSFPTLYFLNQEIFSAWMLAPIQFCALMAAVCLAAGSLGMWLARMLATSFIDTKQLSFPVSSLIYHSFSSSAHDGDSRQLLWGAALTGIFCALRDGFCGIAPVLQKTLYIIPSMLGRAFPINLFPGPTLWAIGFSTGMTVALPLMVGMLAQYLVIWPLYVHEQWLGMQLLPAMTYESFAMAFCSGLVLAEAILGLTSYPAIIKKSVLAYWQEGGTKALRESETCNLDERAHFNARESTSVVTRITEHGMVAVSAVRSYCWEHNELFVAAMMAVIILSFLGFSLFSQLVLMGLTVIATYQICYLGGKVGLLPFGRFSTFVMVPMILVCGLTCPMQITFVCVFVNIAAGVAADLLFGYKVGDLAGVERSRIHRYQWIGLFATALCVGFFIWLLCTHFEIGSAEMFAQRGKSRALLIQSFSLNPYVIGLGAFFGIILSKLRVSPSLVMGGVLMPNGISVGLIIGGIASKLVKQPERIAAFWSGVFASESLWILLQVVGSIIWA